MLDSPENGWSRIGLRPELLEQVSASDRLSMACDLLSYLAHDFGREGLSASAARIILMREELERIPQRSNTNQTIFAPSSS